MEASECTIELFELGGSIGDILSECLLLRLIGAWRSKNGIRRTAKTVNAPGRAIVLWAKILKAAQRAVLRAWRWTSCWCTRGDGNPRWEPHYSLGQDELECRPYRTPSVLFFGESLTRRENFLSLSSALSVYKFSPLEREFFLLHRALDKLLLRLNEWTIGWCRIRMWRVYVSPFVTLPILESQTV